MDKFIHKTIVVSAVNIRKGGTLTILRDCLEYLSNRYAQDNKIIALVHSKNLCEYPGIEYVECPKTINSWFIRLWFEYFTMNKISRRIAQRDGDEVYFWLSLHDTTPRVHAKHQAVYCQTSFPFMKLKLRDFWLCPKIAMFCIFTKLVYRVNVRRNDFLIVQQEWFRDSMSSLLGLPAEKFKVMRPAFPDISSIRIEEKLLLRPTFLYASTADGHKNFETLCEATRLLEAKFGKGVFNVIITVTGSENRYARWLKKRWGDVDSLIFRGLLCKEDLFGYYKSVSALVFASRVETWGLPISEYISVGGKRLLLADLPYAHETAKGAQSVDYFKVDDANALSMLMQEIIESCG